jgi:hypothetical protein
MDEPAISVSSLVLNYPSRRVRRHARRSPDAAGCFYMGLLVICPMVTGVMAIYFGVRALRQFRLIRRRDRRRTIIGLSLGVLNAGFWSGLMLMAAAK